MCWEGRQGGEEETFSNGIGTRELCFPWVLETTVPSVSPGAGRTSEGNGCRVSASPKFSFPKDIRDVPFPDLKGPEGGTTVLSATANERQWLVPPGAFPWVPGRILARSENPER